MLTSIAVVTQVCRTKLCILAQVTVAARSQGGFNEIHRSTTTGNDDSGVKEVIGRRPDGDGRVLGG